MDRFWKAMYWPSILVTLACVGAGFAIAFTSWIPREAAERVLVGLGSMGLILFLLVTFDPKVQRAVRFMNADKTWGQTPGCFVQRPPFVDHRNWVLHWVCLLSFLFLAATRASRSFDESAPVLFAFAGFWLNCVVTFASLRWSVYANDPGASPPVL